MKIHRLVIALSLGVLLFFTPLCYAEGGEDGFSRFGQGEDSLRCVENINLLLPLVKVGEYQEAYPYWKSAYEASLSATKNVYIYGVQILKSLILQKSDEAEKDALIQQLMEVYDNRMKYFGDDEKYPTYWILGSKALDYAELKGAKADSVLLFSWYKASIKEMKQRSDIRLYVPYLQVSQAIFKRNKISHAEFLQIYNDVALYISQALAEKREAAVVNYLTQVKDALPEFLAVSGAADCHTLEQMYAPKLEANKQNEVFLKQTLRLLHRSQCQDSEFYSRLSRYVHQVSPTFESAMGLASEMYREGDIATALNYFTEADKLASDSVDRADALYNMAVIYASQKKYLQSRQFARKATESDPSYGKAYLLIAQIYAADAAAIYPNDPILARVVYYAVIDKIEQARKADTALDGEAVGLLTIYRKLLPSTDEVFMHPDLEKNKPFIVGGWIQEQTVVR